jgi:hypothetical protein
MKGIPSDWMNWGGARAGAGRKPKPEKRVKLGPYVKISTRDHLVKSSFKNNSTLGEVIDSLVERPEKKLVDRSKKKK